MKKTPLKRKTPLKKVSKKTAAKKPTKVSDAIRMKQLFQEIWNENNRPIFKEEPPWVIVERMDMADSEYSLDEIEKELANLGYTPIVIDEERPTCYETGKVLGPEPRSTMFHHVLPKSKYPEYKFCKWNIVLLDPKIHEQLELNIDKTPKVKAYRDQLLETIKQHKTNQIYD